MANHTFRFYATSPEAVFDPIRRKWRSAVVRWDARKVGPYDMWLVVIVLDDRKAADWFGGWLKRHGRSGELVLAGRQSQPLVVEDTIVVRIRLPIWRRLAHRFRSRYEASRA